MAPKSEGQSQGRAGPQHPPHPSACLCGQTCLAGTCWRVALKTRSRRRRAGGHRCVVPGTNGGCNVIGRLLAGVAQLSSVLKRSAGGSARGQSRQKWAGHLASKTGLVLNRTRGGTGFLAPTLWEPSAARIRTCKRASPLRDGGVFFLWACGAPNVLQHGRLPTANRPHRTSRSSPAYFGPCRRLGGHPPHPTSATRRKYRL